MTRLEYCACSHPLDHIGKPCRHEAGTGEHFNSDEPVICPCPSGVRVDLAAFQLLVNQTHLIDRQNALLAEQCQSLARILAVLEESSGLKSRLVDAGNGRAKVEVKPKIVLVGG